MMKTFKNIALIALLLVSCLSFAQGGPMRDKVKTLKIAFITEELQLSSKEAQSFWPIYNQHEQQMEEIRRKERMQLGSQMLSAASLSEEEASELLSSIQRLQQEKHSTEVAFLLKLKEVLPSKKVVLLIRSEEAFKRRLLQQYRKNRR